jgi:hypothetical protein
MKRDLPANFPWASAHVSVGAMRPPKLRLVDRADPRASRRYVSPSLSHCSCPPSLSETLRSSNVARPACASVGSPTCPEHLLAQITYHEQSSVNTVRTHQKPERVTSLGIFPPNSSSRTIRQRVAVHREQMDIATKASVMPVVRS